MEKKNTFEELDANKENTAPQAAPVSREYSMDSFSDTAVGDSVKYVRPNLSGKEDVVESFQVFMPDTSEEPRDSLKGTSKYWIPSVILTYQSKNEDGVNNREYISGAKVFQQKDGSISPVQFWYKGGSEQAVPNQMCELWELVAEAQGTEPEEMSPRQFVAFLNMKPKVKIEGKKYKNFNAPAGAPSTVTKNMVGSFLGKQ